MNLSIRDFQGKRVHMIGIGGSSMSGLAGLLKQRGYLVSGSDNYDIIFLHTNSFPFVFYHASSLLKVSARLLIFSLSFRSAASRKPPFLISAFRIIISCSCPVIWK